MTGRRLRINCDDLGYHPTINEAIVEILSRGTVRSTSLMPAAPYFEDAIQRLAAAGIDRVGVHLTLGSEYRRLPIQPLCGVRRVPSLVDEQGIFPRDISMHREQINLEEAEIELRAQIERARQCGLRLTHLDGHMFFYEPDVGGPGLAEVAAQLARAYALPIRWRSPAEQGSPTVHMVWKGAESFEERRDHYLRLIAENTLSFAELIIHPGKDLTAMRAFSSTGHRRFADYLFFRSAQLETALADNNVEVVGWDELGQCDAC